MPLRRRVLLASAAGPLGQKFSAADAGEDGRSYGALMDRLAERRLDEVEEERSEPARQPEEPTLLMRLQETAGNGAVALALSMLSLPELNSGIEAALTALVARLAAVELSGSVGAGGRNDAADVAAVAGRLEALGFEVPADITRPDASLGSLIQAIERYQGEVVGLRRPDGRIDPHGRTLKAMNRWAREPAEQSEAAAEPAPPEVVPSPAAPETAGPQAAAPAEPAAAPAEKAPPENALAPEKVPTSEPETTAPVAETAPAPAKDSPHSTTAAESAESPLEAAGPEVDAIRVEMDRLNGELGDLLKAAKAADRQAVKDKDKAARTFGQEQGDARDRLVDGIEKVRQRIAGLTPESTGLTAAALKNVRALLYRTASNLSPYYYQIINANILHDKDTEAGGRTCNVTSVSMCLEAMGKSVDDFTGDTALLEVLRAHYAAALTTAADSGTGSLADLRLPDFLQLLAVAKCFSGGDLENPKTPAFVAAVEKARGEAINQILRPKFFLELTSSFGLGVRQEGLFDSRMRQLIDEIGRVNRGLLPKAQKKNAALKEGKKTKEEVTAATVEWLDQQLDADIAKAEAALTELEGMSAGTKSAQKKLDAKIKATKAALAEMKTRDEADVYKAAVDPDVLNAIQPLDAYAAAVEEALGKELDAGNQVIGHVYHHFIRVQAVSDEGVTIDDPGNYGRHDYVMPWKESREIGGFTRFTVVTA
jgi:uncharacterized small protein (DUF1192 family)